MKLIISIIGPDKLPTVQTALKEWDPHIITVSEVLDCRQAHHTTEIYRASKFGGRRRDCGSR